MEKFFMDKLFLSTCLAGITAYMPTQKQKIETKPNIVIIYADDLGYGDIGVNGAKGVKTPNIDRLTKNGVNFTDAHCSATTSPPSRYSLLTGKAKQFMAENTLIIFSSDNGPILNDGYADQAEELLGDHKPAGPYRGAKYSVYEAGTRMPTIVYWPGKVKPGTSSALITQVDLYASFAKLVGQIVQPGDAPDSEDHLDTWLGKTGQGREWMMEEAFTFALRKGNWKYITPKKLQGPDWFKNKKVESGISEEAQLYDLNNDPGETTNVAAEHPKIVQEMQAKFSEIMK